MVLTVSRLRHLASVDDSLSEPIDSDDELLTRIQTHLSHQTEINRQAGIKTKSPSHQEESPLFLRAVWIPLACLKWIYFLVWSQLNARSHSYAPNKTIVFECRLLSFWIPLAFFLGFLFGVNKSISIVSFSFNASKNLGIGFLFGLKPEFCSEAKSSRLLLPCCFCTANHRESVNIIKTIELTTDVRETRVSNDDEHFRLWRKNNSRFSVRDRFITLFEATSKFTYMDSSTLHHGRIAVA